MGVLFIVALRGLWKADGNNGVKSLVSWWAKAQDTLVVMGKVLCNPWERELMPRSGQGGFREGSKENRDLTRWGRIFHPGGTTSAKT